MNRNIDANVSSRGCMSPWVVLCQAISLPLLFLVLSISKAQAAQTFKVSDGDSIKATISSRDLTRVTISGETRISKAWSAEGVLEITPDKERGEAYVIPLNGSAALSFFVQDDQGATYTIVAEQKDIPSETIILQPKRRRNLSAGSGQGYSLNNTNYVKAVKSLMKAMATGEGLDGFVIDDVDVEVPLWKETHIHLMATYAGYDLLGEVYVVTNVSEEKIDFLELEFLEFGKNVRATALERLSIEKGESTFLYVVRQEEEG